mgnify:CR=1 FL=1
MARFRNRRQIHQQIQIMKSLLKRKFDESEEMTYGRDEAEMKELFNKLRTECREKGLMK